MLVAMVHMHFSDRIDGKVTWYTWHSLAWRISFLLNLLESIWVFSSTDLISYLYSFLLHSLLSYGKNTSTEKISCWKCATLWCTFVKHLWSLQQLILKGCEKKYCSFCQQEALHECKGYMESRAPTHTVESIFTNLYIVYRYYM